MSTRSLSTIVLLLIGVGTANAEPPRVAEARLLVPAPLRGWSAGAIDVDRHVVFDAKQTMVVKRTYTSRKADRVTVTVDTFNPLRSVYIEAACDKPATTAARRFDVGPYHGIATGPEDNPDSVAVVVQGATIVSIVRERGSSDAMLSYVYSIDYARIKAFADGQETGGRQARRGSRH